MAFGSYRPFSFGGFSRSKESLYWKPGEDFLKNTFHFPPFQKLPHENGLEYGYWEEDKFGVYQAACAWFFMAEIIYDDESQSSFNRNRVGVRDRDGHECLVYFYPKDLGGFDFKTLKKGSTILVTNGQKHNFLDLTVGMRCEYLDGISVVPCSLSDLLQLSNIYHTKKDSNCWTCGKSDISMNSSGSEGAAAEVNLKKCAACKMARYCSKECQKKDWYDGHKRTCKGVPLFHKLTLIDYRKADDKCFLRLD